MEESGAEGNVRSLSRTKKRFVHFEIRIYRKSRYVLKGTGWIVGQQGTNSLAVILAAVNQSIDEKTILVSRNQHDVVLSAMNQIH